MTTSAAPVRLGISVSNEVTIAETIHLARTAEEHGLAEIWIPESSHGRGIFTVAAAVAAATSRISIGIGIVNPFWRHPSVIAMEGGALDELSDGRLLLGLGAALWTLKSLGEDDERGRRPLAAMDEAFQIVRSMLEGGTGIDGSVYRSRADGHLDFETRRPSVPLYSGAVNAKMLQLSGVRADGVELGAIASPGYARWAWGHIEAGAVSVGRDPAEVDLASLALVSIGRDRVAARAEVKRVLAYYLWRVEGVVVDQSGADLDQVAAVRAAVASGGVEAGIALIDDALIDVFAAAGEPDDVAARLQQYIDAGVRGVLGWHVFGPDRAEGLRLFAGPVAKALL